MVYIIHVEKRNEGKEEVKKMHKRGRLGEADTVSIMARTV